MRRSLLLTIACLLASQEANAQEKQDGTISVADAEKEAAEIDAKYAKDAASARQKVYDAKVAQAEKDIRDLKVAQEKEVAARAFLKSAAQGTSPDPEKDEAKGGGSSETSESGARDFAGLKLGVGLSLTVDIGSSDRVIEATVVNGIVRAVKTDNSKPRIMLESHYFFTPDSKFLTKKSGDWGLGPFVAIRPGSEEVIDAIAFGGMIGFRFLDTPKSFNIGLGLVIDPSVQILGEGIKLNQPLPEGETEVRYRETSQKGLLGMVSFNF